MKSARLVPGHAPFYSKEAAVRGNDICFATRSYGLAGFAGRGRGPRFVVFFRNRHCLGQVFLRKAVPLYKRDI